MFHLKFRSSPLLLILYIRIWDYGFDSRSMLDNAMLEPLPLTGYTHSGPSLLCGTGLRTLTNRPRSSYPYTM